MVLPAFLHFLKIKIAKRVDKYYLNSYNKKNSSEEGEYIPADIRSERSPFLRLLKKQKKCRTNSFFGKI